MEKKTKPKLPAEKRERLSIDLKANPDIRAIIKNAKDAIKKSTSVDVEYVEIVRQAMLLWGKKRGYYHPRPD